MNKEKIIIKKVNFITVNDFIITNDIKRKSLKRNSMELHLLCFQLQTRMQ